MKYFGLLSLIVLLGCPLSGTWAAGEKPPASQPATEPGEVRKITLAEFETLRAEPETVVLDVRTPREFAAGHVPGAVNIDWHSRQFNQQVQALDKGKRYLVHCMAGVRSAAAAERLRTLDFTQVYDFSGGWSAYERSGKPVEK